MNRPTLIVFLFFLLFVETIILASQMDYVTTLEQENERLRAKLAPKPDTSKQAYDAVLCPSGNSIAQRIDKRRWDGVIYRSYWRRVCI